MSASPRPPRRSDLPAALAFAALVSVAQVAAETFVVDRADDPSPPPLSCSPATPADCSLRGAVLRANSLAGADVIQLGPGVHTLTISGSDDLALVGDLDLLDSVEVIGAGVSSTLLRGQNSDRIFHATGAAGPDVTVRDLQIEKGSTVQNGGGVFCESGTLRLLRVRLWDNLALEGGGLASVTTCSEVIVRDSAVEENVGIAGGGGVLSSAPLLLERVTLAGNETTSGGFPGGGLWVSYGTSFILHSRLSDNTAGLGGGAAVSAGAAVFRDCAFEGNLAVEGGALWFVSGGVSDSIVVIERSELSANAASSAGGAIQVEGDPGSVAWVELINSTISGNAAPLGAGIRIRGSGSETLLARHSTLAGQLGDGVSLRATGATLLLRNNVLTDPCQLLQGVELLSFGGNLEALGDSCQLEPPGDAVNVSGAALGLGPLADNGGANRTRALSSTSVALGFGNPLLCEPTDQRGAPRTAAGCDSGAFELVPGFLFADGFEQGSTSVWDAVVSAI